MFHKKEIDKLFNKIIMLEHAVYKNDMSMDKRVKELEGAESVSVEDFSKAVGWLIAIKEYLNLEIKEEWVDDPSALPHPTPKMKKYVAYPNKEGPWDNDKQAFLKEILDKLPEELDMTKYDIATTIGKFSIKQASGYNQALKEVKEVLSSTNKE